MQRPHIRYLEQMDTRICQAVRAIVRSRLLLATIVLAVAPLAHATPRPHCDASLWHHVYHSYRLHVRKRCMSVTGVVRVIRRERDGDDHILLRPDPAYTHLLDRGNITRQHGDLVLEPVCEHRPTQRDAKPACRGFSSDVRVPPVGSHVLVDGSYVLDADHGWMEIHPVTSIAVLGRPSSKGHGAIKVWVNASSGVYHCRGSRWYGNTRRGRYMSQSRAEADGYRAAHHRTCR